MSFSALNINKSADHASAFLDYEKSPHQLLPQILHNEHVKIRGSANNLKWEKEGLPFDSEYELQKLRIGEQMRHGRHLLSLAEGSETTKDPRLVKECKSPTRLEKAFETLIESKRTQAKNEFAANGERLRLSHDAWLQMDEKTQKAHRTIKWDCFPLDLRAGLEGNQFINKATGEIISPRIGQRAAIARIYGRDWSGESKIRVMAQGSLSEPPPQQAGERKTSQLSQKGASKILDSGAYVSAIRGGFTTFLTLTFDANARERILSQESTIGKEVSRFFDAASKMYQRGWQCDNDLLITKNDFQCVGASAIVPPANDSLDYLWVAEMPDNKNGEANPHCHVLLRWSVEPYLFHDWASKIERLWGQGFAKLERIKSADAASGYLLKALGYVVKGESKEQGTFRGNRYNISKAARAPAWECLAEFEAQNMCAIINEVREKWARKDKPIRAVINHTKTQLERYKKAYNIQKAKKGRTQAQRNYTLGKMQKRIAEYEKTIKDHYQQLNARGARANEYQVTFKSDELLAKFLGWASTTRLWGAEMLSGYLQDKVQCREATGKLIKAARDYYKSFGDNGEYAEQIWSARLKHAECYQYDEPKLCDSYNEYLTMTGY